MLINLSIVLLLVLCLLIGAYGCRRLRRQSVTSYLGDLYTFSLLLLSALFAVVAFLGLVTSWLLSVLTDLLHL